MTGEVINFPTKTVRDWLIIERAMNESLLETQLSPPAQARLVERMKSFYETLQLDFNFTIKAEFPDLLSREQIGAVCMQVSEKVGMAAAEKLQAFTNKLFFDRLAVEIDLCLALGI
jgi:hypothetical protein